MGSEWTESTLEELSSSVSYGYTESASSEKIGPHFLRITDIQNGLVDWDSVPYCPITEKDHLKYKLNEGDIVVARTGNSTGENFIFEGDHDAVFASYLIRFAIDENLAHPKFVWYSMRSPSWWAFVNGSKTGSAQAGANAKVLGRFPITLPPLPEQKAIAHILGSLDDKIELNRRMNATLEGMAQALFKSWFVDFDPVIDNALAAGNPIPDELAPRAEVRRQALANDTANREAAKPFPAAFQETESMGWIPEGWEVESIYKLISVIYGAPFKSSMFIPAGEGMPVIRIRDLKTGTPQNWTTEDHPKKKLIKTGDVVVGMDAEFRATIWPGENGYLNQRLFLARPKEGSVNNFFVQHSLAPQLEFEENTQVGTTVSHLGKKELDKFTALNPGKELLFEYSKATTPLLERLVSNHVALKTLTRLRDTLLPKLISGELRVSEAEQLTEEALT